MGRYSFEGGGEGIGGFTGIPDGGEAFSDGEALPVAVILCLLFLGVGHASNCLIHVQVSHFQPNPRPENPGLGFQQIVTAALARRLSTLPEE
jgi:hypothetical protein